MAIVTRKISDLSGLEAPEEQFATIIVRQHPKVAEPKRLDALPEDLEKLKPLGDVVVLEIRMPDTSTREIHVKHADFAKLMSDDDLTKAPGTKGRQPGFSPKANGN